MLGALCLASLGLTSLAGCQCEAEHAEKEPGAIARGAKGPQTEPEPALQSLALLDESDILIDDTPLAQRESEGWSEQQLRQRHPGLVAISVMPFGAQGPKAAWLGEEINLILEVSGQATKEKGAKTSAARNLWVPAINNHGAFGRWAFLEVTDPWDVANTIRAFLAKTEPKTDSDEQGER